jgi:hypothetical protein
MLVPPLGWGLHVCIWSDLLIIMMTGGGCDEWLLALALLRRDPNIMHYLVPVSDSTTTTPSVSFIAFIGVLV